MKQIPWPDFRRDRYWRWKYHILKTNRLSSNWETYSLVGGFPLYVAPKVRMNQWSHIGKITINHTLSDDSVWNVHIKQQHIRGANKKKRQDFDKVEQACLLPCSQCIGSKRTWPIQNSKYSSYYDESATSGCFVSFIVCIQGVWIRVDTRHGVDSGQNSEKIIVWKNWSG